jgi:tetratricopeptide (TPR) repeat protein
MIRQDWLMRLIEQLGEFVRRIAGLSEQGRYEEALHEADRAWSDLLGVPREVVDRVDGPTLAQLLREPAKQRAAAELLVTEARAFKGKGDPLHAALCYRRALELYLEARAQDPQASDDAAILELARDVPPGEIDSRYRI